MLWLVKGNIARQMDFEVDWASAVASTTYVLTCRLELDLLKCDLTLEETKILACLVPNKPFDPSWWTSFGFKPI